jgi:hypothetical protein|tara:strand:- start:327 stop:1868 length:1542 start_codon:yes stop_codon:yes gene_type:complete
MSYYKQFSSIFDGLRAAYGTYKIDKKQLNGKKNTGKAGVVRETRTKELWEGHLSGKGQSVGIIPINEENNCKWGCVDIDLYNFDHKKLIDKIRKLKLPLVVCRSKSGGAHVFIFTSEWVSAKNIQEVLRHVASLLGYGESEIFPKQIKLNLERGDVGNFLNMPYYDHEDGLRYAIKDDGTAATIEEFFELHKEYVCTPEQLSAVLIEEDTSQPIENGPPCLQVLCREKISEGGRNNGLFNIGVYLRKAYPDSWETEILNYNMQYLDPPLPLNEVNVVAKQLQKKDYAYKCKDAPINSYCNAELCKTRKFGIDAAISGVLIANLRKYNSQPPVWFLDVNGQPLELDTEGLMNQITFQRSCVEQLNFMPRSVTKPLWEGRINTLLDDMTQNEGSIVEVSADASVNGRFYAFLDEFCTSLQQAQDREEILLRRPYTDEKEEKTFFRLVDLENHLTKANFKNYKTHQIAQRLRDINGEATQINIKGKSVRVWAIPAFNRTNPEIPPPDFGDETEVPF